MKKKFPITQEEAIENFSTILDLDLYAGAAVGIIEDRKLVITSQDFAKDTILWTAPDHVDLILDILKASLQSIYFYLQELVKNPATDWQDEKTRKGLQETMDLVAESVLHLDEYFKILKIENKFLSQSAEYKQLRDFYVEYVEDKFSTPPEGKEEWSKEWEENEMKVSLDLEKSGLENLETLRRDENYELFLLTDDEKKPFFNPKELRNIRLVGDFDEALLENETDPILLIRQLKDRDFQAFAYQLHKEIHAEEEKFYKAKIPVFEYPLAEKIHKMLMALMLTANPKNLMEVTSHKNCIEYFLDFLILMREAFAEEMFQNFLVYPERVGEEKEKIMRNLLLTLGKRFFFRVDAIQKELLGLIHRLKQMSRKPFSETKELFLDILEGDEKIREVLQKFPNGPLGKNLDVIRMEEKENIFFDPISQENLPCLLYKCSFDKKDFIALHIPTPTHQSIISHAEIVPEFYAFLHKNILEKRLHFLIQLQDRASWKEAARASLLEHLSTQAKYKNVLELISISRSNAFYHQTEEFLTQNDAKILCDATTKEFLENSFFPPHLLKDKKFVDFLYQLPRRVHEIFFASKNTLQRKERQDFIEIVHHLLIAKLLYLFSPESFSFTCKDGLDNGGAFSSSFFAFLQLVKNIQWDEDNKNFLLYLFYARPLKVRERAIDSTRLLRALSFLSFTKESLNRNYEKIIQGLTELLGFSLA